MYRSTRSAGVFEVGTRIWPARGVSLVRWPDARWVSLRFRPCRSSRNKPGGFIGDQDEKRNPLLAIINNPHIILGSIIPVYQKINQGFEHCSNRFSVSVYWISLPFTTLRYVSLCFCIFLASYKSYHFDSLTENDTYFFNYYHHIWDLAKYPWKFWPWNFHGTYKNQGIKKGEKVESSPNKPIFMVFCRASTLRVSWQPYHLQGQQPRIVHPASALECGAWGEQLPLFNRFCWASTVDTIASIAVKTIPILDIYIL